MESVAPWQRNSQGAQISRDIVKLDWQEDDNERAGFEDNHAVADMYCHEDNHVISNGDDHDIGAHGADCDAGGNGDDIEEKKKPGECGEFVTVKQDKTLGTTARTWKDKEAEDHINSHSPELLRIASSFFEDHKLLRTKGMEGPGPLCSSVALGSSAYDTGSTATPRSPFSSGPSCCCLDSSSASCSASIATGSCPLGQSTASRSTSLGQSQAAQIAEDIMELDWQEASSPEDGNDSARLEDDHAFADICGHEDSHVIGYGDDHDIVAHGDGRDAGGNDDDQESGSMSLRALSSSSSSASLSSPGPPSASSGSSRIPKTPYATLMLRVVSENNGGRECWWFSYKDYRMVMFRVENLRDQLRVHLQSNIGNSMHVTVLKDDESLRLLNELALHQCVSQHRSQLKNRLSPKRLRNLEANECILRTPRHFNEDNLRCMLRANEVRLARRQILTLTSNSLGSQAAADDLWRVTSGPSSSSTGSPSLSAAPGSSAPGSLSSSLGSGGMELHQAVIHVAKTRYLLLMGCLALMTVMPIWSVNSQTDTQVENLQANRETVGGTCKFRVKEGQIFRAVHPSIFEMNIGEKCSWQKDVAGFSYLCEDCFRSHQPGNNSHAACGGCSCCESKCAEEGGQGYFKDFMKLLGRNNMITHLTCDYVKQAFKFPNYNVVECEDEKENRQPEGNISAIRVDVDDAWNESIRMDGSIQVGCQVFPEKIGCLKVPFILKFECDDCVNKGSRSMLTQCCNRCKRFVDGLASNPRIPNDTLPIAFCSGCDSKEYKFEDSPMPKWPPTPWNDYRRFTNYTEAKALKEYDTYIEENVCTHLTPHCDVAFPDYDGDYAEECHTGSCPANPPLETLMEATGRRLESRAAYWDQWSQSREEMKKPKSRWRARKPIERQYLDLVQQILHLNISGSHRPQTGIKGRILESMEPIKGRDEKTDIQVESPHII